MSDRDLNLTPLELSPLDLRLARTAGNEWAADIDGWLPCHCGATRVTRSGECRDCTAVVVAGGAR